MSDPRIAQPEIWLIGGYGDVGLRTAFHLAKLPGFGVVLAGRDAAKAASAAASLGGNVRGVGLDISSPTAQEQISRAAAVINFVETCPPDLPAAIAKAGGIFIETSAEAIYLGKIADRIADGVRGNEKVNSKGLVVLSVGTSPGLTNILARQIKDQFPQTSRIDLCLEMGLGRHYGQAATAWFLRNLSQSYSTMIEGRLQQMKPGQLSRRFCFTPGGRSVPAIGYGLSDQLDIARELDMKTVRTFSAFAPSMGTGFVRLIVNSFLARAISRNARRCAKWMSALPTIGPVRTRMSLEGFDDAGRETGSVQVVTSDQSEVTAAMTALTTEMALTASLSGITHSDYLVSADAAISRISRDVPGSTISW
ncbi:hypothetical protein [Sulfitobacter sp. M13]